MGCDDFGPKTGFVLDPLVHQQCYDDEGQYCDIICRKRGADGRPVTPSIKETGQALTKLFCEKVNLILALESYRASFYCAKKYFENPYF